MTGQRAKLKGLAYPSWCITISISSLVASLLFLGNSMHYGWRYHQSVAHMFFYFQGVHYNYPLTVAAIFLQRYLFLWSFPPIALYFLFRIHRQFSLKKIEQVNAFGIMMGVLLINVAVGSYIFWHSASEYEEYKHTPLNVEPSKLRQDKSQLGQSPPVEKQETTENPLWRIWPPQIEKTKIPADKETAQRMMEAQTKSVTLLLDWAVLLITGVLLLLVKDLGILFTGKQGEEQ